MKERKKRIYKRVVIFGMGLIGGSLGLALKHWSLSGSVAGIARHIKTRELALECGAADEVSDDPSFVRGADLVVVATPVCAAPGVLGEIAPFIDPGTTVTDVGSTKSVITCEAMRVLPPDALFIGGHPMTGSEREGLTGAHPYLFENAFYILTPGNDAPEEAVCRMSALVTGLGARPVLLSPGDHDLAVAAVSHMPHLVAVTLVNSLFDMPECDTAVPLAAGGFRDTTRIAAGNPDMWRDIFLSNSSFVLEAIQAFSSGLAEFEESVRNNDGITLYRLLSKARNHRKGIPARTKGYLPALWEIVVTVPDQPGIIAMLAGILGEAGININDIEILRVREGEGGAIRLAFASEEDQSRAVDLFMSRGIPAKKYN